MTKTTLKIEQQLKALRVQHKRELIEKKKSLEIKERLLILTGLEFLVVIHGEKSISAFIENDFRTKFNRADIKKYFNAIVKGGFTPKKTRHLTFASGDPVHGVGCAKIEINNGISELTYRHPQRAKVSFGFECGLVVSFTDDVSKMFAKSEYYHRNVDVKPGRKDPWTKAQYFISGFKTVNYYGGDTATVCVDRKEKKNFMELCFTGGH